MSYVIGTIASFVNEDKERCEKPDVQEASDGRSYTLVILSEECEEGVIDFSDGECYTIFATADKLNSLATGARVRVSAKE
jgi:hypothetical protein